MKLSEAFPLTSAAYPQRARWEREFDWRRTSVAVCYWIVGTQHRLIAESDAQMTAFSASIQAYIIEQTAHAPDEAAASCIDWIRFLSGVIPGQRTLSLGQLGDCYGWMLWGISRTHDPAARVSSADHPRRRFRHHRHEASRDIIAALRDKNMITAGPRSPTPGALLTYVTTNGFLEHFGLDTLRNLPDLEALEDAGLLNATAGGEDAEGPPFRVADVDISSAE